MKRETEDYQLFSSGLRGDREVEDKIESVLSEKETTENLATLSRGLAIDWNQTEKNVARLKMAFSDLQKKIDLLKPELVKHYASEKEKQNSPSKHRSCFPDSNAVKQ